MIPRRIDRRPDVADNYSNLAEYIAAAGEKGEKLDKFWIVNCKAGTGLDDLKTALYEIEATRTLRPDIADKTYHLVVSFRPGEEKNLSEDDLEDIERTFAEALGYGEHQRVAGTHINTDNCHMHIAFNKVHPSTLRVHTPRRDFFALEKAARALEQRYGLYVDKGASESLDGRGDKARVFEAKTWQQSFETHLKAHKVEILAAIAAAKTWTEVHDGLAPFDAELRKRGAGLVFKQVGGRWTMKASALGRSCSLKALEPRLGPYQSAPDQARDPERRPPPKHRYAAPPLFHHPGQDRLWRVFRAEKKSPGVIARNVFNIRSWKEYLLADAHKDVLALAIILTYKEALHVLEGAPRPTHAPKSITPALRGWFASLPWEAPESAWEHPVFLPGVGLKVDGEGKVLFPMRDADGRVWAIRAVDQHGRTCDLGDLSVRPGLRHVIDRRKRLAPGSPWRGTIVLAAHCTAGAEIHRRTGSPVVIAARERDLPELAKALRARHPGNPLVIAAPENSRAAARAAKLVGGRATTPEAVIAEGPTREIVVEAATRWAARSASAGRIVSVDPDVAEAMGAFVDDALSADDAFVARTGAPAKASTPDPARDRLRRLGRWVAESAGAGKAVSVDPEVAEAMAAFVEDALTATEAIEARPRRRTMERDSQAEASTPPSHGSELDP